MAADTNEVPDKDLPVLGTTVTGTRAVGAGSAGVASVQERTMNTTGRAASTEVVTDGEVIPVLRETINVSKREVETGRVVVHKTVSERDEAVEVLLRRTDVSVERVPVGRTVTEAPASRQEGDVLIIPVMEEVLVVEKRLVLKEELRIRTTASERTSHEVVRLRTESVQIEPTGNVTVPGHVNTTPVHTTPVHTTKEG